MELDMMPRVHGQWIEVSYYKSMGNGKSTKYYAKRCSVCKADAKRKSKHNFCPNCGAIMDIKQEF